jgi:hypothetical protein
MNTSKYLSAYEHDVISTSKHVQSLAKSFQFRVIILKKKYQPTSTVANTSTLIDTMSRSHQHCRQHNIRQHSTKTQYQATHQLTECVDVC